MDSGLTKVTTLLFLVATFCLASIASAEEDDGHSVTDPIYPPPSPVRPTLRPPVDPPSHSLVDPPVHLPAHRRPYLRGIVAVKGAVFCQYCYQSGSDDLTGASPIEGAVVKVQCKNDEKVPELIAVTDTHGFFSAQTSNVTTYAFNNCKAYLVSSPLATCNIQTDVHSGITGAKLKRRKPIYLPNPSYTLYSVEPFAFLPKCNWRTMDSSVV